MDGFRLRTITLIIAAALIGLGVGLALGLFEGDGEAPEPAPATTTAKEPPEPAGGAGERRDDAEEPDLPRTEDDPEGLDPGPSGPAPSTADETAAADAARAYVDAIDDRRGRMVCAAFAPGGMDGIDLPLNRGSCPSSLEASLGFKGGDGQPVWARSEMTDDVSAQIEGDSARVVATVFTEYAEIREPTIEDDIIYLTRSGERWLVVKPSSTLYRAVGIADVPLQAFRPPR